MTLHHLWTAFRRNLRRAIMIALIVGTILVLINHGDHIQDEPVCSNFFLKAFLSYVVPFSVSIVSAILADHRTTELS